MLFIIHQSIAEELKNNPTPPDYIINSVELLAHAYRRGYHLLLSDRTTLKTLLNSPHLSSAVKNIYKTLYKLLTTRLSFLRQQSNFFIRQVEVVAQQQIFTIRQDGSTKTIIISADYISQCSITEPTLFLCENSRDIQLYQTIARYHLFQQQINNLMLRYEPRGGGGNTTADEYHRIQSDKNRLCLCLTDSDRNYLGDRLGATASRINEDINQLFTESTPLNVCTAENVIPTQLYKQALPPNDPLQKSVIFLEQLERTSMSTARNFYPFKKGLRLLELQANTPSTNYWSPVAQMMGRSLTCWTEDITCTKKSECTCYVLPHFGSKILETAIRFMKTQTDEQIANLVDNQVSDEWQRLGELIVAWLCGGQQLVGS